MTGALALLRARSAEPREPNKTSIMGSVGLGFRGLGFRSLGFRV